MNGDVGIKFVILLLVGFFGAFALAAVKVAPDVWAWWWALSPLDAAMAVFIVLGAIGFVGAAATLSSHTQMMAMRPPPRPSYPADPETRI